MTINNLLIKNVRVIDPAEDMDITADISIIEGKIKQIGNNLKASDSNIIDASGLIACPGFIDLHCHLRQPGFENKETIASGAAAASRGGYTTICCMPNTNPPLDNAGIIDYVKLIANNEAPFITLLPIGCITRNRAGKELTDMNELAQSGCAGFSDDGAPVSNSRIMSLAMENSGGMGLPIIDHCEDMELSKDGQINDGWVAARLGLKGIPAASEETIVARDINLAEMTGAKVHVTHISTKGSVEIIRHAKKKGIHITSDTTPHHLTLTEDRVMGDGFLTGKILAFDTNAKVNPPLRTKSDIDALIEGLKDGTIDAIATDHAPHAIEDKLCELEQAAFGISGFDSAFGVLMTLVHSKQISLGELIACLTIHPARILNNINGISGSLKAGSIADIVLLDNNLSWTMDTKNMLSQGKNTPYNGQVFKGMIVATIHHGTVVYKKDDLRIS
jgi:dihydroorotase